jgi:hypothetical protein
MENQMTKILIATPAYGEMFYTPYVQSLYRLTRLMDHKKWASDFCSVSYSDIAESRNILLTYWYEKTDASHLLFIDADMGFEPQLISDMIAFDKPVVGVIYPKKTINLNRVSELTHTGQSARQAIANSHDFVVRRPLRSFAQNGFVQVEGCGTGIFLIQRACINVMLQKMPELIDVEATKPIRRIPDIKIHTGEKTTDAFNRFIRAFDYIVVDRQRLTEDYSFCYRWRHYCGGEVWANGNYEIVHIGAHRFKARYNDAHGPRVRVVQLPITKTSHPNRKPNT